MIKKVLHFFKNTYSEMKQVIWPSRKRAVTYALVVIVFSVALGYLLGGFDALFKVALAKIIY
jgi:preprotein translocase subunit SecE